MSFSYKTSVNLTSDGSQLHDDSGRQVLRLYCVTSSCVLADEVKGIFQYIYMCVCVCVCFFFLIYVYLQHVPLQSNTTCSSVHLILWLYF